MRTSNLAILSLVIATQAVLGCNHGTNVEPLHRPRPAPTTKPKEVKSEPTPSPPAPAPNPPPEARPTPMPPKPQPKPETPPKPDDVPATPPVTVQDERPDVAQGPWCHISDGATTNGFLVNRYAFTAGETPTMTIDQLLIVKDQPPVVGQISATDRWSLVSSDQMSEKKTRTVVEPLSAATALASPAFDDQNTRMSAIYNQNGNLEDGADQIGLDGGLRVTTYDPLKGPYTVVVFPCADYSPSFVSATTNPATALKPAPQKPTPAPAPKPVVPNAPAPKSPEVKPPVDPMTKVDATKLVPPLKPYDLARAGLDGSRWCSWTKAEGDVKIGALQFGADRKVILSRLSKTKLEADLYDAVAMNTLPTEPVREIAITGVTGARLATSDGRGYRMVEDQNETRVLIADAAPLNAAPAANAEVFYQCLPDLIPGRTPLLKRNLGYYMDLRERWSRE